MNEQTGATPDTGLSTPDHPTREHPVPPMQRSVVGDFIATGFFTGFLKPFPGSWGSIIPTILAWFLIVNTPGWVFALSTMAMIAVSIVFSTYGEAAFGHDDRRIVIDEWAGVFVTALGITGGWKVFVVVFVMFRIFDVLKPYPARRLEGLTGGWGITADDVAAGVYANIATRMVLWLTPATWWIT